MQTAERVPGALITRDVDVSAVFRSSDKLFRPKSKNPSFDLSLNPLLNPERRKFIQDNAIALLQSLSQPQPQQLARLEEMIRGAVSKYACKSELSASEQAVLISFNAACFTAKRDLADLADLKSTNPFAPAEPADIRRLYVEKESLLLQTLSFMEILVLSPDKWMIK